MKITKLLPLALTLMLMSPATFAVDSSTEQLLEISVPDYVAITVDTAPTKANATFNADYSVITLSPQIATTFKVVNNKVDRMVYLKATAKVDGDTTELALYGDDEQNMKIVFTNENALPAATSVTNITGTGTNAIADNPNAIAFKLTSAENFGKVAEMGALDPTIAFENQVASYKISNGVYNPVYTVAVNAEDGTFSTHDQNGEYKATLLLSTTTTP